MSARMSKGSSPSREAAVQECEDSLSGAATAELGALDGAECNWP